MSQFQILGRRPFPFKAIPIRFAYTNFPDTIDFPQMANFGREFSGSVCSLAVLSMGVVYTTP